VVNIKINVNPEKEIGNKTEGLSSLSNVNVPKLLLLSRFILFITENLCLHTAVKR
jgi:hypothetical protein